MRKRFLVLLILSFGNAIWATDYNLQVDISEVNEVPYIFLQAEDDAGSATDNNPATADIFAYNATGPSSTGGENYDGDFNGYRSRYFHRTNGRFPLRGMYIYWDTSSLDFAPGNYRVGLSLATDVASVDASWFLYSGPDVDNLTVIAEGNTVFDGGASVYQWNMLGSEIKIKPDDQILCLQIDYVGVYELWVDALFLSRTPLGCVWDHSRSVVAYNETLFTDQAARRANGYLVEWGDNTGGSALLESNDITAMDTELLRLQDEFIKLYHAYYGPTNDRDGNEVPLTLAEQALAGDPAARDAELSQFFTDCNTAKVDSNDLLQQAKAGVVTLQQKLDAVPDAPDFNSTASFLSKPSATLDANGNADGIIFGTNYRNSELVERAAVDILDFDFYSGVFDSYHQIRDPSPVEVASSLGRKTDNVIACESHGVIRCDTTWYNAHEDDVPSIFSRPYTGGANWLIPLDFHHPEVISMLDTYLTDTSQEFLGEPNILYTLSAWEPKLDYNGGFGYVYGATLNAYHQYLIDKFGTISSLNSVWDTSYTDFDDIQRPVDPFTGSEPSRSQLQQQLYDGNCPPNHYEYCRFYKDSFTDYLSWSYDKIKAGDPNHPVVISPTEKLFDGSMARGFDGFALAETACDMYGNEQFSQAQEIENWSIGRLTGRQLGNFEYLWNGLEGFNNFAAPEDILRSAYYRNIWRMIGWGRKVLGAYGLNDTYDGVANNNMLVWDSDFQIIRMSAGIMPVLKKQLRSMEDIWLNTSVVEPKIVLVKPSASTLCNWPEDATYNVGYDLSKLLCKSDFHYAVVPEEYFISGRDSLDNYDVLVFPFATYFPADSNFNDLVIDWYDSGGTIVSSGIAGGFTEYGAADGTLMEHIIGDISYTRIDTGGLDDLAWDIDVSSLNPDVQDVGSEPDSIFYIPGRFLMAADADDLKDGGEAASYFNTILEAAAPRFVWQEGSVDIEIVERADAQGRTHLILINPYSSASRQATIHLARKYSYAVDRGVEGGFAIPLSDDGLGGQQFDIELAAGEATLVSLYGVNIVESDGYTDVNEAGTTTDTYTIVLDFQPDANVVITVDPDTQTEVNINGAGNSVDLTFTTSNWDTAQTVTVKAIDDSTVESSPHTSTITHTASSSDVDYNDISIDNVVVNVTDDDWDELTNDDFESGWGNFNDGGNRCSLNAAHPHEGNVSALITDNSGDASSFYTYGIYVSSYSQIKFEFWFYANGMESGEDFFVEFWDGDSWETIATYVSGTDFSNDSFYQVSGTDLLIDSGTYNFSNAAQFKFRCDASKNDDKIYIDEIVISAR